MAMNGNQMGQEVAEAIMNSNASPEAKTAVIASWQKICNAIVDHITANAEVPSGISVSTSGGAGSTNGAGNVI